MNAIGWGFIFSAIVIIVAVARGQVFDANGRFVLMDNARLFITALITGDAATVERLTNAEAGGYNAPEQATTGAGDTQTGSGNYSLGPVKPHVQRAADIIGPMFGIKTIGGYRAVGSVPNSLHPKGRALDFMVRGNTGEQLAAYAVANRTRYGITEVIWNRRIWTIGRGWHGYNGPSPHTDHVHLSFVESM